MNCNRLAKNFKFARNYAQLTQNQLANRMGISVITIRQYEAGKRQPRLEQIEKLAQVCGIQVAWLFMGVFDD